MTQATKGRTKEIIQLAELSCRLKSDLDPLENTSCLGKAGKYITLSVVFFSLNGVGGVVSLFMENFR